MSRRWLSAATLAFLPLLGSCDWNDVPFTQACTLVDCSSSVSVGFASPINTPGHWTFAVSGSGLDLRCSTDLPRVPGEACPPEKTSSQARLEPTWVDTVATMQEVGVRELAIVGTHRDFRPQRVKVTVEHDGVLVGEREFEPTFEELRPNGDDCGPTCYIAPPVTMDLAGEVEEDAG